MKKLPTIVCLFGVTGRRPDSFWAREENAVSGFTLTTDTEKTALQ
jgi:hypothetical protein